MDEWIAWKGGKCPLPVGALHQRRYREGGETEPLILAEADAAPCIWAHSAGNRDCDIVAYRLIKEA